MEEHALVDSPAKPTATVVPRVPEMSHLSERVATEPVAVEQLVEPVISVVCENTE